MKDKIVLLLLLSSTVLAQTGSPLPGAGVSSSTPTESPKASAASSSGPTAFLVEEGSTDKPAIRLIDGSSSISRNINSTTSSNGKSSEKPAGTTISTGPISENSKVETESGSSVGPSHEASTNEWIKNTSPSAEKSDKSTHVFLNKSTQSPSESTAISSNDATSNAAMSNGEDTTKGASRTISDDTKNPSVRTSPLPVELSDGTATPSSVKTITGNFEVGSDSSNGPSGSPTVPSAFTDSGFTSSSFNGASKVVFEVVTGETLSTSDNSTGESGDSNATTPSGNDSELHHETTAFSLEDWLRNKIFENSTDYPMADATNETTANSVQTENTTTTKCVDGQGNDCSDEFDFDEWLNKVNPSTSENSTTDAWDLLWNKIFGNSAVYPIADSSNETSSNSVQTENTTTTKCVDGEGDNCSDEEDTEEYRDDDSEYDYDEPREYSSRSSDSEEESTTVAQKTEAEPTQVYYIEAREPESTKTETPKSEKVESTTQRAYKGNRVYEWENPEQDDKNVAKFYGHYRNNMPSDDHEEHRHLPRHAAHHGSDDVSVESHEYYYQVYSNGFENKRFTAISIICAIFAFLL
ncbi:unnamed protein product [Caenorhabditis nigoni]